MAMYGADVAQLRELARQFDACADRLESTRMSVGNAIQISAWVGPYASTFRLHWESSHSRRIASAVDILRANAQLARQNADGQDSTSTGTGSRFPYTLTDTADPSDFGRNFDVAFDSIVHVADFLRSIDVAGIGVSTWDMLPAVTKPLGTLFDVKVPGLQGLGNAFQAIDIMNDIRNGTFDGWDIADLGAGVIADALKRTAPGSPQYWFGVTVAAAADVVKEASKMDLSPATVQMVGDYAAANPGVVLQEIGKATLKVGAMAVGWILP